MTNATRILDSLGIRYETLEYEVDPEDLSAETVANKIGMPAGQVFKTLLLNGDHRGNCFAVIPGDTQLDFKALAKLTGDRAIGLVPLKDVQPLTGYIRGGVTVFGARKRFPVYVDETMNLWDRIAVSAGVRGMQIVITPGDYIRAAEARCGEIARS